MNTSKMLFFLSLLFFCMDLHPSEEQKEPVKLSDIQLAPPPPYQASYDYREANRCTQGTQTNIIGNVFEQKLAQENSQYKKEIAALTQANKNLIQQQQQQNNSQPNNCCTRSDEMCTHFIVKPWQNYICCCGIGAIYYIPRAIVCLPWSTTYACCGCECSKQCMHK